MERIEEMLGRLSELSEGEMSDLEGQIVKEFETVEQQEPTSEVVATMTALADALETVRAEQANRIQTQQELAAQAAEQSARVHTEAEAAEQSDEEDMDDEEQDAEEDEEDKDKMPVMASDSETFSDESTDEPEAETETTDEPEAATEETDEVTAEAAESTDEVEAEADVESAPEAATPEPEVTAEDDTSEVVAEDESEPADEAAPEAEAEEQPEVVDDATPEISAETPTQNATPEEYPVAASATDVVVKAPAEAQPVVPDRPQVTVTAGADISGVSAGSEFSSLKDVSTAFVNRLHALRRVSGGDGEQHIVASIHADYPEDRTLHAGQADENWEKIEQITSRQALTAAANCYPLDTQYSLFGVGVADRPARDALAMFSADRAGLRFYNAPTLDTIPLDGTGPAAVWEQDGTVTAADGTTDLSGVKPCFTITCGDEQTALLEAVSSCLTFDNLTTRANPEIVARHNELALIHHARVTELHVLGKIKAGGTAVTGPDYTVGAAREYFVQLDGLSSAYRYKYRMGEREPLRVVAPVWLRDLFRADIAMQMPGDGLESLAVAQSMIDGWFRARNVNVSWTLDSIATPPSATTGQFGATVEWDMYAEGTWLYLDGGVLDIGVIRDSTLLGSNDYKTFTEEFMAVAKIGDESLHVTSTVQLSGAAAALVDTWS